MAHVFLLAENKTKYIKIRLKNFQKQLKGMSVLRIPDAHACALYVCACVLEMRHWFGRSYHVDPDPYSQKHFIGGSADLGSGPSGP